MSLTSRKEAACTVLAWEGPLGVDNHVEFKDKLQLLIDGKEILFILDLSRVEFIDSTGLGVMTAFLRRLKALGGNLVLAELQDDVKPIFEITGLKRLFTIADTLEEALRKLA